MECVPRPSVPWSWVRSGEWPSWGCCGRWRVACLQSLSPEPRPLEVMLFLLLPLHWPLDWCCRSLIPGMFFECSRTLDVSSAWRRQMLESCFLWLTVRLWVISVSRGCAPVWAFQSNQGSKNVKTTMTKLFYGFGESWFSLAFWPLMDFYCFIWTATHLLRLAR